MQVWLFLAPASTYVYLYATRMSVATVSHGLLTQGLVVLSAQFLDSVTLMMVLDIVQPL
jgi:hypothetical protein